jgi:hypothetical protein
MIRVVRVACSRTIRAESTVLPAAAPGAPGQFQWQTHLRRGLAAVSWALSRIADVTTQPNESAESVQFLSAAYTTSVPLLTETQSHLSLSALRPDLSPTQPPNRRVQGMLPRE